jgi:nucleoside-diphosphate-sugar epimerase
MTVLVTGASGFLGSHIAERLVRRGDRVRCLVRSTSQTDFLEELGVELVRGDITDAPGLVGAFDGVDTVYHAAAMVDDWGPWEKFRTVTINGTRNMLKAASAAGVGRFLHVSTDGVYKLSDLPKGVNEESPFETHFGPLDYYRRSKTAAEKVARRFHDSGSVQVSIVRPALILGERDAAMLPSLIAFLKSKSASVVGDGTNRLPIVYAGDVADLCILAATSPNGAGRTYNAVNPEHITQADLYETIAEHTGVRAPTRHIPFRALYVLAAAMEATSRLRGWSHRPELTRFGLNLIGLDYQEDPTRAMSELGWSPEVGMEKAVMRSVEWARASRAEPARV